MIGAAALTLSYLGPFAIPLALIAGDIGRGRGSQLIYRYLLEKLPEISPKVLVLHYLLPNLALMKQLGEVVEKLPEKPKLIADAASMYAAKAAGLASKFDLFTPDPVEIAFLADPDAWHPAYINKHLFDKFVEVPDLISQAYQVQGAAKVLLVKGPVDYIAKEGRVIETVSEPNVPAMEAIGGTGDMITGIISAFIYAGLGSDEAAIFAAKANRLAGEFTQASPGTKVWQLIQALPEVFEKYLCTWSGICIKGGGHDRS